MEFKEDQHLEEEEIKELAQDEERLERLKQLAEDNPTGFRVVVREFMHDKAALASVIILVGLWIYIFGYSFFINEEAVMRVDIFRTWLRPMEQGFLLGTDMGGRPIFEQLVLGARNSILIGLAVTLITSGIGIIVGLAIGYYGGWVDNIVMRLVDFVQVLPTTLLIIVIVTLIPKYTMTTFVLIMSGFYWTGMTRLVRSMTLSESRQDYVSASKTMGTSDLKIMYGGILPNISSILIVDLTITFAANIGIETGLSYLGFGLPPSTPSLGILISYARRPEVISDKLYVWLPASLLILVMMLSINYIGAALRRASDAQQRVA